MVGFEFFKGYDYLTSSTFSSSSFKGSTGIDTESTANVSTDASVESTVSVDVPFPFPQDANIVVATIANNATIFFMFFCFVMLCIKLTCEP